MRNTSSWLVAALVVASCLLPLLANAAGYAEPQGLGLSGESLEVARNADGTLLAFVIEKNKEVTYVKQAAADGNDWLQRKSLGIYANEIAIGRHADGRLALFNIGLMGNVLYQLSQKAPNSDEWTEEAELKGAYGTSIEPISAKDGSLVLFFVTPDKRIAYVKESAPDSNSWGAPVKTGLYATRIALGTHPDGRIELVNIGTLGNVLYHVTEKAAGSLTWTEEKEIKGAYATQIELAANADGSLLLFAVQPDKEIASASFGSGGWSKAEDLGIYGNQVTVGRRSDGRLEMFIIGVLGNVLTHSVQAEPNGGKWGPEEDLKKAYATHMGVATHADGRLDLVFISPSGKALQHVTQVAK